jgi:hypothetical protein
MLWGGGYFNLFTRDCLTRSITARDRLTRLNLSLYYKPGVPRQGVGRKDEPFQEGWLLGGLNQPTD